MTEARLVREMSSTEFTRWIALHNLRVKEQERAQRHADAKRGRF